MLDLLLSVSVGIIIFKVGIVVVLGYKVLVLYWIEVVRIFLCIFFLWVNNFYLWLIFCRINGKCKKKEKWEVCLFNKVLFNGIVNWCIFFGV